MSPRVASLVFVAACYAPRLQVGSPCATAPCPSGLVCSPASETCELSMIDAAVVDARPPPPSDTVDACASFSSQFQTCDQPVGGAVDLDSGTFTFDTTTGMFLGPGAPMMVDSSLVVGMSGSIRVIHATGFTLTAKATLVVVGNVPFGVAASGPIAIDGVIDVANGGAGSRATCAGGAGQPSGGGGGGGGGGGFGGDGGFGGGGDTDGLALGSVAGGHPVARPAGPIGGCAGGDGGAGGLAGGAGGRGGGAVYLVSAATIAVTGAILAGGNGGRPGAPASNGAGDGGGGGGGSGGMIWLEAPSIMISGIVVANGGGGGEGSTTALGGAAGSPGGQSATPAAGGSGGTATGGDGGAGGARDLPSHDGGNSIGGGGGGGGGVGFIVIDGASTQMGAIISPAPSS